MANYALTIIDNDLLPVLLLNDRGVATTTVVATPHQGYVNIAAEWKVRIRDDGDDGRKMVRIKYTGKIRAKRKNFSFPAEDGVLILNQSEQDDSIYGRFIPHNGDVANFKFESSAKKK